MLTIGLLIGLFARVFGVGQFTNCPDVESQKFDFKALDGKWYFSGVASDMGLTRACATVTFSHTGGNTTDLSIMWVTNQPANFYNGTAAVSYDNATDTNNERLNVTYSDGKNTEYALLAADYSHYAVIYSCNNTGANASSYELWQLSRQPHLKAEDAAKINETMIKYNLTSNNLITFNNTEECCKVNSGIYAFPTLYLITSTVAASFLTRIF